MLLGHWASRPKFKDHRQGRDPLAATLGPMASPPDCREDRFDYSIGLVVRKCAQSWAGKS
jgi:hypothetical protein